MIEICVAEQAVNVRPLQQRLANRDLLQKSPAISESSRLQITVALIHVVVHDTLVRYTNDVYRFVFDYMHNKDIYEAECQ